MPPNAEGRLRVGTRGSALAVAQAEYVCAELRAASATPIDIEIVKIRTSGDRHRDKAFDAIGPKGIFARDIQRALLDGDIDVAVHSLKDLPATEPEGLLIAAVPERAEPGDVLVSREGTTFAELPDGARVGTSSSRRSALLAALRPGLEVVPLRGNVDTRIGKVRDGEVDAAVLAAAGIVRIGRTEAVSDWLDPQSFVPPPGQGALAIETRSDRFMGDLAWLSRVEHDATRAAVDAERVFMEVCEGGCEVPLGGWARWEDGELRCTGFLADPAGTTHYRAEARGTDPERVGVALAEAILEQGGSGLLDRLRGV